MKKRLLKISFLQFFSAFLLASISQAQQCLQLFPDKSEVRADQDIVHSLNSAVLDLDQQLRATYTDLKTSSSQRDQNYFLQKIVEINNHALELFDIAATNPKLNSSKENKEIQGQIINNILQLFRNQGMSSELVGVVVQTRVNLVNRIIQEMQNTTSRPIGFIHSENKKRPTTVQTTIGFLQQKIEAEPYGRKKTNQQQENDSTNKMSSIGFIQTLTSKTTGKPLASIGFVQPTDAVDVSYKTAMGFNVDQAVFMAVSNQPSIGFR